MHDQRINFEDWDTRNPPSSPLARVCCWWVAPVVTGCLYASAKGKALPQACIGFVPRQSLLTHTCAVCGVRYGHVVLCVVGTYGHIVSTTVLCCVCEFRVNYYSNLPGQARGPSGIELSNVSFLKREGDARLRRPGW